MGLLNELSCEAGSFSCHCNPHRFLQSEVLRLYFPTLEPLVVWSVLFPSFSSQFTSMQMWDCPPPIPLPWSSSCHLAASPFHTSCPFPPLLPVWMNVSSLTPWYWTSIQFNLLVFLVMFLFLSLLLSFFWLCKKAKCVYLHLHRGWESAYVLLNWCFRILGNLII